MEGSGESLRTQAPQEVSQGAMSIFLPRLPKAKANPPFESFHFERDFRSPLHLADIVWSPVCQTPVALPRSIVLFLSVQNL